MKLVSNQKQSKSSKNMKLKTMEEYSIKVNPYGDASTTEDDMQDPNEDSVKRNNGMHNKNPVIPSMYEHAPSSFQYNSRGHKSIPLKKVVVKEKPQDRTGFNRHIYDNIQQRINNNREKLGNINRDYDFSNDYSKSK